MLVERLNLAYEFTFLDLKLFTFIHLVHCERANISMRVRVRVRLLALQHVCIFAIDCVMSLFDTICGMQEPMILYRLTPSPQCREPGFFAVALEL